MKQLTYLLFSLFLTTLLLQTSCKKDPCEEVTCQNGGTCIDGDCDCPEGFIGANCEVELDPCLAQACVNSDTCLVNNQGEPICFCKDGFEGELCDSAWNAKYVGTFNVTETCVLGIFFQVEISPGPRFNEITIANFHDKAGTGGTAKVVAQAATREALFIPEQFMHFGKVNGLGALSRVSRNSFTMDYTVIQGTDTLTCGAVFERVP